MTTIIETIYENGVFRPLTQPVDFQEHQHYVLTILHEMPPLSKSSHDPNPIDGATTEIRQKREQHFGIELDQVFPTE